MCVGRLLAVPWKRSWWSRLWPRHSRSWSAWQYRRPSRRAIPSSPRWGRRRGWPCRTRWWWAWRTTRCHQWSWSTGLWASAPSLHVRESHTEKIRVSDVFPKIPACARLNIHSVWIFFSFSPRQNLQHSRAGPIVGPRWNTFTTFAWKCFSSRWGGKGGKM